MKHIANTTAEMTTRWITSALLLVAIKNPAAVNYGFFGGLKLCRQYVRNS